MRGSRLRTCWRCARLPAVNNTTYEETIYRYGVADQQLEAMARGRSCGCLGTAGGVLALVENPDAIDVSRRILEWFDRYLQPSGATRTQ